MTLLSNPYVGPRTFTEAQGKYFFGREREERNLTARIVSERLLLFYAQSGAGKSSLISARVIPRLRDREGFQVLPVGRVSGELPAGVSAVDNIYAFNLMNSLDQSDSDPARLAQVTMSDFLARLGREAVVNDKNHRMMRWVFKPELTVERPDVGVPQSAAGPRFVLIIDQFEEIFTSYPGRWPERDGFFHQLNQALLDDPNLWVMLTLREDYVAALDPYSELAFNRLRARFHMERMGVAAALEAVSKPAQVGGRPFVPGVAEKLVDDLRQMRVPGREDTIPGQYVEPVQLQVVCYQLWERVGDTTFITEADLAEAGDVNQALEQFYADTLAAVLAENTLQEAGVTERGLRTWFDRELITETGIRNTVFRNEAAGQTGSLPNVAVDALARRFLLRSELRGGGAWVELVHDRFVEPIRANNAAWFPEHLSALQRQAALWDEQGRSSGLLLRDEALAEAEAWAEAHTDKVTDIEKAFLTACQEAQNALVRERQQSGRIRVLAIVAGVVAVLAVAAFVWALANAQVAEEAKAEAEANAAVAEFARMEAQANAEAAREQLDRQAALALVQEAYELKKQGDAPGAIEKFRQAQASGTELGIDVENEIEDVRSQVATQLAREGEVLARAGDMSAAAAKFQAALDLEPPSDTPIYTWVTSGTFLMGSEASEEEKPFHEVWLDGYWIQRTEVTNGQFKRCVFSQQCEPPDNSYWDKQQYDGIPVTNVTWFQANQYADWVGGRLPTEAEWEKACRGTDSRMFSWGDAVPSPDLGNITESGLPLPNLVGSYPPGAYGLYDMSGNVWEWTSSLHWPYPYAADDGRENQADVGDRVLRGGAFNHEGSVDYGVSCTVRGRGGPGGRGGYYGFRIVMDSARQ